MHHAGELFIACCCLSCAFSEDSLFGSAGISGNLTEIGIQTLRSYIQHAQLGKSRYNVLQPYHLSCGLCGYVKNVIMPTYSGTQELTTLDTGP